MCLRSYGANTGTATTVRNGERLVEVEVRNVASDVAVAGETEKRVEVCTVDVDLTTGVMDCRCDGLDPVFVDPVGRRVCDHECRERIAVLLDFRVQVGDVNVTVFFTSNDDNLHSGQDGGRCVSTVSA
ncbi:unannotated protein [freshwater metagenome]|uniref:Unannotated protein n=1 Tax=freshwater metagenome TaxID=449393 RepID=A0A6J6FNP6_9ZZZZ